MDETRRILFVNSEIFPYLPETDVSHAGRFIPQGIQECGREIRLFMPRYGCINERRNQLHEVIRLSGMNIDVGGNDYSLVIKVASIAPARMQVYFIDNEDFFQRKQVVADEQGVFFADNGERAIFFAKGVLETVKKLRWKPDIIHCQGWISHFLPIFLKKAYRTDPLFEDAKVVLSLYNEHLDEKFCPELVAKAAGDTIPKEEFAALGEEPTGADLTRLAVQYSDGIIAGCQKIDSRLAAAVNARKAPILAWCDVKDELEASTRRYNQFYDKIISDANNVKIR